MPPIIGAVLTAAGFSAPAHAANGADALRADPADIVLLDLQLPDTSGLDVLAALRARPVPPAVVVVTAHGSETAAAQALRLGADDYLVKDAALPDLLPQVVERQRRNLALRSALAAAERDLVAAERLAAIGQITVTLHHALNNPLMAASTEIELLLRDASTSSDQREALESVQTSLVRIGDAVRRAAELQAAPVVDYLEGAVKMVDLTGAPSVIRATGRGNALVTAADPGLARILGHLLSHAGFAVETCDPGEFAARLEQGRPRLTAAIFQAGAVAPSALPPRAAGQPLFVSVGAAAALADFEGKVAFTVSIPFDPGVVVQEIIARLERRIS